MSKHTESTKAVCGYYKHEDPQMIYCKGIVEGSVVHLAFATRVQAVRFKQERCYDINGWKHCPIARMLREELNGDRQW